MVCAEGHFHHRLRRADNRSIVFLNEFQKRIDAFTNLVAALAVDLVGTADGVGDFPLVHGQGVIKFSQQEGLFCRVRKHEVDHVDMAVRHADDHVGLGGQCGSHHHATLRGDVDIEILHGTDRVLAWRLAVLGAHAGRYHDEVCLVLIDKILEQALGHRAAADIASADEQDCMLHITGGRDCGFSWQWSTVDAFGTKKNAAKRLLCKRKKICHYGRAFGGNQRPTFRVLCSIIQSKSLLFAMETFSGRSVLLIGGVVRLSSHLWISACPSANENPAARLW